jgi:hypothetical protein
MQYRKKPIVIEAMQFTGDNIKDIAAWCSAVQYDRHGPEFGVLTLEGYKPLPIGYWVIKGVKGEFYPCEPEIFAATYEEVVLPDGFPPSSPMPDYCLNKQACTNAVCDCYELKEVP